MRKMWPCADGGEGGRKRTTLPRKNLMKVGIGTWGRLGIAASSHGGHRVRLAPSWVHEISLGPSWDRLEVTMGAWGHMGHHQVMASCWGHLEVT